MDLPAPLGNVELPPLVYNAGTAVAILVASLLLGFLAGRRIRLILQGRVSRDIAVIVSRAVSYTIYTLGVIAALSQLGVNVNVFLLAGGVAGIVIGFASQTIAANLLSGIFLYLDRPFKQGEPVEINGIGGILHDISVFSTKIRRWDGVLVRIPNEEVFKSVIEMPSRSLARRIEHKIPLPQEADVEKARNAILKSLETHSLVLAEPKPEIYIESLGEYGTLITVRYWTPSKKWFDARMSVIEAIRGALKEEGIEVAAPRRIVEIEGRTHKESREEQGSTE